MALTVENVRSKQWDKSNLWDIYIVGIDFSTKNWIPANDIEYTFHGIENGTVGETNVNFAKGHVKPTLTMSYMDDENLTMTHALREWQEHIVSKDGIYVKPIYADGVLKQMVLSKLNHKKEVVTNINAYIYPTGTISYHGDSDGSTPIYTVTFEVVKVSIEKAF